MLGVEKNPTPRVRRAVIKSGVNAFLRAYAPAEGLRQAAPKLAISKTEFIGVNRLGSSFQFAAPI